MSVPQLNDKSFQIHTEWVNSAGDVVKFSSDYMTFYDCLNVKSDVPHSCITYLDNKGRFRSVRVKEKTNG